MKFERLGNICTVRNGYAFKSELFNTNGVPIIRISDISGNVVSSGKSVRTSFEETFESFRISKGDVLIAMSGATTGKYGIYISDETGYQNQRVGCFLIKNKSLLNNDYLLQVLRFIQPKIEKKAHGSGQPNISSKAIEDFVVPLPPLPTQLHIANILSKAENLIAQRKESIRLLDEFLKSTFLEMFGDPVRNEKKWSKTELKNYAKVRIGPFGSLLHREDYVQNGVPLVNPSHISEGKIFIDQELTISKTKIKELSAYIMHEGDVVLGRRGEIGRCAVVTKKEDGYLCGTGSIYIRPTKELNAIFLYNIISSVSMRKVLENSAKGITMKNLNSGIIENLKIPIPPLPLQTQFAQIVEKTEALKTQYQQSLQELEHLYGSLSQRAFKGELVSTKAKGTR